MPDAPPVTMMTRSFSESVVIGQRPRGGCDVSRETFAPFFGGPTAGHVGHLSESTRFVWVATIDAGRGTTPIHTRGTRLATPTIDVRVARLERRAESDDNTLRSILQILERMDRRFASVEADVATLKLGFETLTADVVSLKTDMDTVKTDMDTVKADIATLTTVTDVLALKVASIEATTADTNKRVRVRGFEE